MSKIILPAKIENLDTMLDFIQDSVKNIGFNKQTKYRLQLASEEALVNVINYAYPGGEGDVEIACDIDVENQNFIMKIIDSGIAFNPLEKEDPDLNLPMEKRQIGGLGIYMIREIMDEVRYKRENGKNILTLIKSYDSYSWLIPYMNKETYNAGEYIFKKGDKADKIYYIDKGSIKLEEINITVKSGHIIGEMGVFSPFEERTASALCEENVEVYTMGEKEATALFYDNPSFGIKLVKLITKRFLENYKRLLDKKDR